MALHSYQHIVNINPLHVQKFDEHLASKGAKEMQMFCVSPSVRLSVSHSTLCSKALLNQRSPQDPPKNPSRTPKRTKKEPPKNNPFRSQSTSCACFSIIQQNIQWTSRAGVGFQTVLKLVCVGFYPLLSVSIYLF